MSDATPSVIDTIVAIATPPGSGGVGIIRLSGPLATSISEKITHKKMPEPRYAAYRSFKAVDGALIEKGLLLYFKAPHSFTGEEVVEYHAHGSPIVLDELLHQCVDFGARLANPGEFSERAFLNGKLDLTQAEAICDLIHASSQTAARMAVRSLQGDFSKHIEALSNKIITLRAYVEASLDFSEEDINLLTDTHIAHAFTDIFHDLHYIQQAATQGVIARDGMSVVISGRPNAGKSTLINRLAGREVAIVTPHAGTTRDLMREAIMVEGLPIHLTDTAGLRDSPDPIEQEGIIRAWGAIKEADCVLLMKDLGENADEDQDAEIVKALAPGATWIRVYNKTDAYPVPTHQEPDAIYLSAKLGNGIEALKKRLHEVAGFKPSEGTFLARRRHIEALARAELHLTHAKRCLYEDKTPELLAEELRIAHHALCEVTGEFTSDALLGTIFSTFCIGK